MNIRQIANFDANYFEINREERNYAAIFFSALCLPGNAERFLKNCEFPLEGAISPDFSIYFEYAFLRDLWKTITNEEVKKDIIRKKLPIKGVDKILSLQTYDINKKFGVGGKISSDFIQFPGRWSIANYNENFPSDDDFLEVCKFKWSFNIKPDIVIQLSKNHSICIEAKYESREGFYPSSEIEKRIFAERNLNYVGQLDLQKYMMEELLGMKAEYMFLVHKKEKRGELKVISWAEAFKNLDIKNMPKFAKEMISNISDK